jgi:putative nucleotidyltransferase with HDIG domain
VRRFGVFRPFPLAIGARQWHIYTMKTTGQGDEARIYPLTKLPPLDFPPCGRAVPSEEACRALWDKYEMPEHIRAHSCQVARFSANLAELAAARGHAVRVEEVRACALLHDIAKSYTLRHGGSHAQLGAAWALAETGHAGIAQGILHHVYWPWPLREETFCTLPILVLYADKRTQHADFVTLEERFADIAVRYGIHEQARLGVETSQRQPVSIERALSARLGVELDAYTPDSGRLVERA